MKCPLIRIQVNSSEPHEDALLLVSRHIDNYTGNMLEVIQVSGTAGPVGGSTRRVRDA
jgi:hypothetical protein